MVTCGSPLPYPLYEIDKAEPLGDDNPKTVL